MTSTENVPMTPTASSTVDSLLSIKDNYTCHIRHFARYLEAKHLTLDYEAVRAYFADLNASTLAAGTKRVRRQAVKARMRLRLTR